MVSGTNGTVGSDGSGDDDVTDGTGRQLVHFIARWEHESLHGTGGFSPTEPESDLVISYRIKRIAELAYDSGGLLHDTDIRTIR
jgi:hypothetical protein